MIEFLNLYMTPFCETRRISVYLPHTYHPKGKKRYPVIYMHDGQNVFRDSDALGGTSLSLEDYLDQYHIDVIVVGIDQNPDERINEYCPWVNGDFSEHMLGYKCHLGGKGEQYIDFVTKELKPFIDRRYLTLKENTSMVGISLGGLISVYAACKYPRTYKQVAVLSSAFWRNQEKMEELISKSDLSSIHRLYMDWGDCESEDEEINRKFHVSNERVAHLLKDKVPNFTSSVIVGGTHHYTAFKSRVPQIFAWDKHIGY
ncbi:alpha/beta hydrolase [Halobacillus sp. GSS1]|uniref:alpha/beta hydrolase n=1 Tax=Halobacillus sp. GSS1 TaxID=2815919 RepID=UPI001A8DF11F|nr:alpha/beta hydrolase-fold protein [Halobacillus sp. GSS1]MBN9653168.1 alpha/beta hydrolase [Halobacillus sp. GSS1]